MLRDVPVGAGRRKSKKEGTATSSGQKKAAAVVVDGPPLPLPLAGMPAAMPLAPYLDPLAAVMSMGNVRVARAGGRLWGGCLGWMAAAASSALICQPGCRRRCCCLLTLAAPLS